jgi:hypothetical protein
VLEMQCFGSAGCSGQVCLKPECKGAPNPEFDGDYDVTYRITGDEDGPIIGTFTIYKNGKYDTLDTESIYPPWANTPITAMVTSVEESYGW